MKKYTYTESHCPPDILSPRLRAINPVCLDILYGRGYTTVQQMENLLFPEMGDVFKGPRLLGTSDAVRILSDAVESHKNVTVYHDYDADGITAGAVARAGLEHIGVRTHLYCNDREKGGFGINRNGVEELLARFPDTDIILTVDNGITGTDSIALAKELGKTVIVTDHHEQNAELPAADAIVDPKRTDEPEDQDRNICGAGVIWKVMASLYEELGADTEFVTDLLDLVATGTVADVVPLLGDNRALVREGLRMINAGNRPFFRVFRSLMNLDTMDSQDIAFTLAPMINAVSRMGHPAEPVVDLLLQNDVDCLQHGILEMVNWNTARKAETERELEIAERISAGSTPAVICRDEGFRSGIVGIVAGKLEGEYNAPALVFTRSASGDWKGSCRSPEGFHMKNALDRCAEYLVTHGGHARAAGVTVRADAWEEFCAKFQQVTQDVLDTTGYGDTSPIDIVLPADDITVDLVRDLAVLEPVGEGFRPPLVGVLANIERKQLLSGGEHVKYVDSSGLEIVQWHGGAKAAKRNTLPKKFVGRLGLHTWQGETSAQLTADLL